MHQRLPIDCAVIGHEQEDQAIDHAQELTVEIGQRYLASAQRVTQYSVLGVTGKPLSQNLKRPFDTDAQVAQGAGALLLGLLGPLLQPGALGPVGLVRGEARCVGREPEQDEVGINLAGEHGLEVELQERLAREGLVVAQDAQTHAVHDDGPEMAWAAVDELLHQAMRVEGSRPPHARGAAVEAHAATDKVYGYGAEEAVDRVGAAANLGARAGRQETEAQLTQQRQTPLVVGEAGARLALR